MEFRYSFSAPDISRVCANWKSLDSEDEDPVEVIVVIAAVLFLLSWIW